MQDLSGHIEPDRTRGAMRSAVRSAMRTATARAVSALSLLALASACARTDPSTTAPRPGSIKQPRPGVVVTSAPSAASVRAASAIVDSVFALTNRERVRAGLTALRRNPLLTRAAQMQADQMAAAEKLGHDVSGAQYPNLGSRLKAVGYTSWSAGENIGEGYTSGAALVAGWMSSSGHRDNILSTKYTETGIGTARARNGRTYHAQVFGTPR